MARRIEVLRTPRAFSRLTITPERITVKIAPAHEDMTEEWTKAAVFIASRIDFGRSLRGRFTPGKSEIWLATDNGKTAFLYDFNGKLIGGSSAEGQ